MSGLVWSFFFFVKISDILKIYVLGEIIHFMSLLLRPIREELFLKAEFFQQEARF